MYPVTFAVQNPGEGRNRLTSVFRFIVAIPWTIVGYIYGFIAEIAAVVAWFGLVFTGRYPDGIYDFVAGYVRFTGRYGGFSYLLTDEYPPFNGDEDPSYPVQVGVAPAKPEYSRGKAFFRLIVGIPVMLLAAVQAVILTVCYIISWFSILFTGTVSDGIYDPMRSATAYLVRATAYFLLLTEDWPPFSLEEGEAVPAAQLPGTPPAAQAPAAPAPEAGQQPPPPPAV
jgi:hypothetical protein